MIKNSHHCFMSLPSSLPFQKHVFVALVMLSQGSNSLPQFKHKHLFNPQPPLTRSQSRFLRWAGQCHRNGVRQVAWHWDQLIAKLIPNSLRDHASHSQSTCMESEIHSRTETFTMRNFRKEVSSSYHFPNQWAPTG